MPREYIVLRETKNGAWLMADDDLGRVVANDDQHAIRKITADQSAEDRSGVFVAVPARSFRVRTRHVETKEIDRWT